MPDVLLRNISTDDLAQLDARAERLGISRTELMRRLLQREIRRTTQPVTVADLTTMKYLIADLADDELMADAWS